ncbi:MAG TPA: SDR family oxidoreductase [Pyrinomonadaceae bacterium]|jgi:3-hydroxybutyryl-CoA dehydratase
MSEAKIFSAEDLYVGLKVSYEREVTEEDVLTFARLSGDCNPLHVDADYAKSSNYQGRIAHGAFQVGLASALLGMHLPGKKVLLSSINSRFPAPLYFPKRIKISGEISAWNPENLGGQLRVIIQDAASMSTTAEIFMGFTLHEEKPQAGIVQAPKRLADISARNENDKFILLTGASGGLGTSILSSLSAYYQVLALTNKQPLDEQFSSLPNVEEIRADISSPTFEENISSIIGNRPLYGIIHTAWGGAPRSGLLSSDIDVINNQLAFGTTITVILARTLYKHICHDAGRFIAIGSTYGTVKPNLQMGAYSLAKASLENAVKLLAPELARKKITANVICPSFIPVGFNKQANQRQIMIESAAVPVGRVCDVNDVAGMINYLLSNESAFVSGQIINLTGGQI